MACLCIGLIDALNCLTRRHTIGQDLCKPHQYGRLLEFKIDHRNCIWPGFFHALESTNNRKGDEDIWQTVKSPPPVNRTNVFRDRRSIQGIHGSVKAGAPRPAQLLETYRSKTMPISQVTSTRPKQVSKPDHIVVGNFVLYGVKHSLKFRMVSCANVVFRLA